MLFRADQVPYLHGLYISVPFGAFCLGTFSGVSLPLGALFGVWYSPVSDRVVSAVLAFGAGSLLFAVTVDIYAKTLRNLEENSDFWHQIYQMLASIVGGAFGALFFLHINSYIESTATCPVVCPPCLDLESHPTDSTASYGAGSAQESGHYQERTPSIDRERPRLGSRKQAQSPPAHAKVMEKPTEGTDTDAEITRAEIIRGKQVALSIFTGLLIDGLPEGIFMGLLAAETRLTVPLVGSLLVANFPEAFAAASLLQRAGVKVTTIIGMWGALCLMTGGLCGLTCWMLLVFYPKYALGQGLPLMLQSLVTFIECFTGGAMLACVICVMLPDAQRRASSKEAHLTSVGFLCTAGFLVSVMLELSPTFLAHRHVSGHNYGNSLLWTFPAVTIH